MFYWIQGEGRGEGWPGWSHRPGAWPLASPVGMGDGKGGVTAVLGSRALMPGACCHVYRTLDTALGSQALMPGTCLHRTLNAQRNPPKRTVTLP